MFYSFVRTLLTRGRQSSTALCVRSLSTIRVTEEFPEIQNLYEKTIALTKSRKELEQYAEKIQTLSHQIDDLIVARECVQELEEYLNNKNNPGTHLENVDILLENVLLSLLNNEKNGTEI